MLQDDIKFIKRPCAPYRVVLAGAGKVGTCFLERLADMSDRLPESGVRFRLVAVAELGGAAVAPAGLQPEALVRLIRGGRPIWTLPGRGQPGLEAHDVLQNVEADILIDATPTEHKRSAIGFRLTCAALQQGWDVVLADKGPLAIAYHELAGLASMGPNCPITSDRPTIQFSAATAGALPIISLGRSLVGCTFQRIEGVLNGTSHLILGLMELGADFQTALGEAQQQGKAETDPLLDVNGWDAAAKLVIIANAVLDAHVSLSDVAIEGISGVTAADLKAARAKGRRILPLAQCRPANGGWALVVGPTAVPIGHALAKLDPTDLGVAFTTDQVPRLVASTTETGAGSAASAVLRDLVAVARARMILRD
jgi:homoserine dehydrogenase